MYVFQLFKTNQDDMLEDLEQGDVAETVRVFFEQSNAVRVNICFISKTSLFYFARPYRLTRGNPYTLCLPALLQLKFKLDGAL